MLTRTVGYLACVFFVVSLALLVYTLATRKNRPRPDGTDDVMMPALAMEFVDTNEKLYRIIGRPGAADAETTRLRANLKGGLKFDYGFIVGYWLLFVGIAAVLARGGGGWAAWVALAAALFATCAAASDVAENLRMARVIDSVSMSGGDVASAGFLKWLFSFLTLALLSFTFFGRGEWFWVIGAVCLLIAGVGLAGLALIRSGVEELRPVVAAFLLMLFVLLPLVAYAFAVRAEVFGGAAQR
jgi:hypothetical protein